MEQGRRPQSSHYIWGGCRTGGVLAQKCVPPRKELVLGRDVAPKIGMRVYHRPRAAWGGQPQQQEEAAEHMGARRVSVQHAGIGTVTALDVVTLPAYAVSAPALRIPIGLQFWRGPCCSIQSLRF